MTIDVMTTDVHTATQIPRLPRVTEVIAAQGLVPSANFTEFARERGTAVHKACAYHAEGVLDEDTVDDVVRPYLEQYKRFLVDSGAHVLAVEQEIVNEEWGFIGHFDLAMILNSWEYLVDIKTGAKACWHPIQLSGYRAGEGRRYRRACLYLNGGAPGSYKFHEWPLAEAIQDWEVFRSALITYKWRQKCGLVS